jgi:hypothetical protein
MITSGDAVSGPAVAPSLACHGCSDVVTTQVTVESGDSLPVLVFLPVYVPRQLGDALVIVAAQGSVSPANPAGTVSHGIQMFRT